MSLKIKIPKKHQRDFDVAKIQVERKKIDIKMEGDNAIVTFPFSSEFPVERWGYVEVLSHEPGCMDVVRLDNHAPLLFNHKWDQQLGVVQKAWVEDKIAYVTVKMSRTDFALEKLKDIEDGILVNVSFGYEIVDISLTSEEKGKLPVYTATKWLPYEVTMCTVPADYTVGLGRSAEDKGEMVELELKGSRSVPEKTEDPDPGKTDPGVDEEVQSTKTKTVTINERNPMTPEERAKLLADDRKRSQEIETLAKTHKITDEDFVRGLINSEKSLDEVKVAIFEKAYARETPVNPKIGMDEKEVQRYSIAKVIRHLANPDNQSLKKDISFELEMAREAVKLTGQKANGVVVPFDVLVRSRRALSVGAGGASGGYIVGTEHRADSFIELLRNRLLLAQMGVKVLDGLVGNIAIPRKTGAAQAYWLNEGADIDAESALSLGQVLMSPKTVGAYTDITRSLLMQSSPSAEMLVEDDLIETLVLEIDRVGFYGTGADGQPTGIKLVDGINTKDFGNDVPTYAEVVDMETKLAIANADVGNMQYAMNPTTRGGLKTTARFANTDTPIWEPGNTVNGYAAKASNQIVSGDVFFANWSDLIVGLWGGLDLTVDKAAKALAGGVRVIGFKSVDYALRNPGSVCRGNNNLG